MSDNNIAIDEVAAAEALLPPAPAGDVDPKLDSHVRSLPTKSAQIRHLASLGWKTGPIAKYLSKVHYPHPVTESDQVRYQHVRNVLNQKFNG